MTNQHKSTVAARTTNWTHARVSACALTVGVLLAACGPADKGYVYSIPSASVQERHPVKLAGEPMRFALPLSEKPRKLTRKEKIDLEVFLVGYRKNGGGPLTLSQPVETRNEGAAAHMVAQIRTVMYHMGISEDILVVDGYVPSEGKFGFPVVLKYQTAHLVLPKCGHHGDNIAFDLQNLPHEDFGCSSQRNLGAMVSNPNDLRGPRGSAPRDSGRRDTVFDAYRAGEPTETQQADDSGQLADVGQ
ncbi:MAG: CpaD family pilus assembly protein [Pseudomonadota bacterium]